MAGRIPEQFIDEVRNSIDIVDVISQYVSLEKKGKNKNPKTKNLGL